VMEHPATMAMLAAHAGRSLKPSST
jgi:hypothetical protein